MLLRGVWERRGELALLRALGFRRITLGWLVLAENGFLLIIGLVIGAISALAAVGPHLFGQGGQVPWLELLGMFTAALLVGLVAGMLAKWVMPGTKDEPSGFLGTTLLGIVGAVIGGWGGCAGPACDLRLV